MKLSTHFSLSEFEYSQTAARNSIDNKLPPEMFPRAELLCQRVLERVREHFGPVYVSSGYRCPKLNKAIGGSSMSQHCRGEAADLVIPGVDPIDVCRWIKNNVPEFDQLIQEGDWTHVSYCDGRNRKQVMTAHFGDGPVHYTNGLGAS